MSLFSKILLLLVALVVAYALWPRKGSVDRFEPAAMANYEAMAWEALRKGNVMKAAWNFYRIYDFQFRVSPVTALNMARTEAAGINSLLRSPDPIDQDRKIPDFVEIATRLRGDVSQDFDPAVAGRSSFAVWVAVSSNAGVEGLTNLAAAQMRVLFSLPGQAVEKAAGLRARALHDAFSSPVEAVNWDKVEADLTGSWQDLLNALPKKDPADN